MTMMIRGLILGCACLLLLQACATRPITTDALPPLQPGEGIAGISFDTISGLRKVRINSTDGSQKLLIDYVPIGQSAFLFVVPAGRYCMDRYSTDGNGYTIETPPDQRCFDVEAGKLSYSGTFVPNYNPGETAGVAPYLPGMTRHDEPRVLLNALSLNYPHIAAAAFPTGSDRSVAELAPPGPPSTGVCELLSAADASALLGAKTDDGVEASALIPACTYTHTEEQVVRVSLLKQASMDSKSMDDLPPKTEYGWSKASPVPEVGDEALFFSRGSTSQLYVLKMHQFILILTVEGVQRPDLQSAMGQAAKTALSRL